MPARKLTQGELIGGGSALVLLVLMLAVPWYGVDGIPGRPGSRSGAALTQTGWDGLSDLRWLILLTVLLAFVTLGVHAAGPARQIVAGLRLALLILASISAVALIIRVLIDLPSSDRVVDQKLGALLGLMAGLALAFGAAQAVREQRLRLAARGSPGEQAISTATQGTGE